MVEPWAHTFRYTSQCERVPCRLLLFVSTVDATIGKFF
jgi:hypothetical protein